ncbi:MAG: complement resistance protein TraT [Burkholderiaceae bacterium]|nr:complement resistance protein TraT [Burkholderiaceae bacterium]
MYSIASRIAIAAAALLATGCANLDDPTPQQGLLIGAGTGALLGAATSSGVIAPVIGAVGGAVVGEELAERDPLLD